MSLYLKIILVILGLAYLISPFDIIPDLLLPFIGWIDDGVILTVIYSLIRHGRLPSFLFKKPGRRSSRNHFQQPNKQYQSDRQQRQSATRQNKQKTKSRPSVSKTPHEILGVKPGASQKEIQTAYKEAIKKYHPDKLSHLGEEFSSLANEKFLEIQKAYERLTEK